MTMINEYKSNTTKPVFKKLKRSFSKYFLTALAFALILSLASCSDMFNQREVKSAPKKVESKTYLTVMPDFAVVRSAYPTEEYALNNLRDIYLYAQKTSNLDGSAGSASEKTLASSLTIDALKKKQFLLADGAGKYTIRMKGSIDGVYFYKKLENVEIKESETNQINIALEPVKSSSILDESYDDYGGFSFLMHFNTTNVSSVFYKLERLELASDGKISESVYEQNYITSLNSGNVTYKHVASYQSGSTACIPSGTYRLTLDFLSWDSSMQKDVVINSYPYIIYVEKGRNTYIEETFALDSVYKITYSGDSGSSLKEGSVKQTKFTRKDEVILPVMEKSGYTFKGWYTTSNYVTTDDENNEIPSGPVEKIPAGTIEDQTFYAKFVSSAVYVSPTGNDSKSGENESNALATIEGAIQNIIARITNGADDDLDWTVYVNGNFTFDGKQVIKDNYSDDASLSLKCSSVTITGPNSSTPATLNGKNTDPVISVLSEKPIIFKNIKITGGATGIVTGLDDDGNGNVSSYQSDVTLGSGTQITGNSSGGVTVNNGTLTVLDGASVESIYTEDDTEVYVSGSPEIAYGEISYSSKVYLSGSPKIDELKLNTSEQIILASDLVSGASITITPDAYDEPYWNDSEGGEIYKIQYISVEYESPIKIADNYHYFHVTQEHDADGNPTDTEWFIDDEGCLNRYYTISFENLGEDSENNPITMDSIRVYAKYLTQDDLYTENYSDPVRTGYRFTGWYYKEYVYDSHSWIYKMQPPDFQEEPEVDDDGYAYIDTSCTRVLSDLTFYATWRCLTINDIYVDADIGADGAWCPENGSEVTFDDGSTATATFGDGTENKPFRSLNEALDLIKEINDSTKDFTITLSGKTNVYNLPLDDDLPVKSLTLKGKTSAETDGIDMTTEAYELKDKNFVSVLPVSTTAPVKIQNMLVRCKLGTTLSDNSNAYSVDGSVMNIGEGSTVTLENGTVFEGVGSTLETRGAVAIEDGGTLIMNEGVTFQNFYIKCGAVNVKEGGTFTMNGGTITNNKSSGTCGAVYVNGGTFEMNGGEIKENLQDSFQRDVQKFQGAGVCVASGTFIMEGGKITGNKACIAQSNQSLTAAGGGVFVYADGTFKMNGGEISDNHAYNRAITTAFRIVDDEIYSTASAYGGGVCLQAAGDKLASFTMTGGTIKDNTAATAGNGICILGSLNDGVTGKINLGGSAVISSNNDIYLPDFVTINVISELTSDSTDSLPTITPASYERTTPLISVEDGLSLSGTAGKFAVTAQKLDTDTTCTWSIGEDGKMFTPTNTTQGSIYSSLNLSFTGVVVSPESVTLGTQTTQTEIKVTGATVKYNDTDLYYKPGDKKIYTDSSFNNAISDEEVSWELSLYYGNTEVTLNDSSTSDTLSVNLQYEGNYTLHVKATYCGVSYDTDIIITCVKE